MKIYNECVNFNNVTIFPDLSWHRVRDNNEIQALLDTGNDYR